MQKAPTGLIVEVRTHEYSNGDKYEVSPTRTLRPEGTCMHICVQQALRKPRTVAAVQGEVLDTLRHGSGKHTCSNGDTYDGAWQYDKRHGRGAAKFARGVSYQGQWKEDMAHGCVAEDCTRLCDQVRCTCTAHTSVGLDDSEALK